MGMPKLNNVGTWQQSLNRLTMPLERGSSWTLVPMGAFHGLVFENKRLFMEV